MNLFKSLKYSLVIALVFTSLRVFAFGLTGPNTSLLNETKTYTYNQYSVVLNPKWKITGGILLSSSVNGTVYTANVKWTSLGTGQVQFKQGKSMVLGTLSVNVGVAPATPPNPYVASYNCATQTLSRSGTPPGGVTWFWQTSTSGTSVSNSNSTKTVSSNGWNYLRAKDSFGWSSASAGVNVFINTEVPVTPATTGAARCGTGNLTLTSSNSADEWFTAAAGGSKFYTGANYTASFSSSTTYYVEAVTPWGCRSTSRAAVIATVSSPSVGGTVTGGSSGYNSQNGTLTLSAYNGNVIRWEKKVGSGSWTTINTTSTTLPYANISTSTSYKAIVKNGSCNEVESSVEVIIIYDQPTISISGPTAIPHGGSVTLTADLGHYAYQWQKNSVDMPGETTNAITVSIPDMYQLRVRAYAGGPTYTTTGIDVTDIVANQNENYVLSIDFLAAGVTDTTDPFTLPGSSLAQSITYIDGLGRPMQTVLTGQSPNGYDIIQPVEYDDFGREARQYLPYIKTERTGTFIENLTRDASDNYLGTPHEQFYASPPANITGDARPFSETIFESSPLHRPTKQFGPGANWFSADKYNESKYEINNTSDSIKIWLVANDMPNSSSMYAVGELYKNVTIDEEGNEVQEFINKTGQTILKRAQAPAPDNWADTYYIYDDFGNLRFVLPPEASKQTNNLPDTAFLNKWAFQYKYDGRNRMVEKQVPGAEPVFMVYDKRDRLVLTQDGNQRLANQWLFTKYDELNRPILTGIYTKVGDRLHLQSEADGILTYTEGRVGTVHGYTNIAYPNVASENDYLTVTYYDNYDYPHAQGASTNYEYTQVYTGIVANGNVKGQVTGGKTKVLDAQNTWLQSTVYYDDKYRVIQSIADNYLGGIDRASSKYDFIGNVLETELVHQGTETHTILQEFNYDHANRLLSVTHKLNNDAEIIISANEYNERGELIDKNLHSSDGDNFEQSVDYGYNIRGWLTHINNADLSDGENDYFGMELGYESPLAGLDVSNVNHNGNISGVIWKSLGQGVSAPQNAYEYQYDEMNRITNANYKNLSLGTDPGSYDMALTNDGQTTDHYDLNGNIKGIIRYDSDANIMDNLQYKYLNGNQLSSVYDNGTNEGFNDGNIGSVDYKYDDNGNMERDRNKEIQYDIEYNHLNLPSKIQFGTLGDKEIWYVYDASGVKLSQIVKDGLQIDTTDYSGTYIYKNDTLQFIQHEEGRIVPFSDNSFAYQYNLKDHLGNVRLSFTTENLGVEEYLATMEDSLGDFEENILGFTNLDTRLQDNLYDHTDLLPASQYQYSAHLNNTVTLSIVGPAKMLEVIVGDTVDLEVYSIYSTYSGSNSSTVTGSELINAIAAAFTPAGASTETINQIFDQFNMAGAGAGLFSGTPEMNSPAAYLNYILYDNNFDYVDAGYMPITEAGEGSFEKLEINQLPITKTGYMYIYVSNETMDNVNVHFDDLKITHKSKVIQSDDYYPFGLIFNSYTRPSAKKNDYLYNGKELQDELDLNWMDYGARMYDPAIGRWNHIDPLAEKYGNQTPYNYALNNPIKFIDPDGMDAIIVITGIVIDNPGPLVSEHRGSYLMYQVNIYENMTEDQYISALQAGTLGNPTSTTMLARDAWNGAARSKGNYGYNRNNEAPPGTYWLNYNPSGYSTRGHIMRLSDEKGGNSIAGPEGERRYIDIHKWSPHDALGCLTTGSREGCSEIDFISLLPSLTNEEDVRVIIDPRAAVWNEENNRWEGVNVGSSSNSDENTETDYSAYWNAFLNWVTNYLNSDDE